MDRQLLDDLFCFTEILGTYFSAEINRLDHKIIEYQKKISEYKNMRNNKVITNDVLSALEYGISQNNKRIELAQKIKSGLIDESIRVQHLCNTYYHKEGLMVNSNQTKCFEDHKKILFAILSSNEL